MESPILSNPTRWWRDRDAFPMSRTHILFDNYTQVLSALNQSYVAARLFCDMSPPIVAGRLLSLLNVSINF